MTKTVLYTYLGTNGTITSPIHLEDIYYTRKIQLRADEGHRVTKDNIHLYEIVTVTEDDAPNWFEVGQV
jgi:hypothetical protein